MQKEYYETNKDKIKENNKKMIYCNCCKKEVGKNNILKHYKTQIHITNSKINI